jgi:hypothetical protein
MKHTIVLLSGKQGSGKTTTALRLLEMAKAQGLHPVRLRFAEPLYAIHDAALPVLKRYGLARESDDKDGDFLQVIGTEYGRMRRGENVWVQITRVAVDREIAAAGRLIPSFITIEDARFVNEFDFFPDAARVRLLADREVRRTRTHAWRENEYHASETGLDDYFADNRFDFYLNTNDTSPTVIGPRMEKLFQQVLAFDPKERK